MVTGKDYEYVDDPNMDESYVSEIRITADNAWNGVQFRYGRISARVIDDDQAELSYELTVTNKQEPEATEIEENEEFQNYVGDILHHILDKAFNNGDYRIGGNDDTDNYIEEPAAQ